MLEINHDNSNTIEIKVDSVLKMADFDKITPLVDELINKHGKINVFINSPNFSGWENFAAAKADFNFVRKHHQNVNRLALIVGPLWKHIIVTIGRIFLHPEIRTFKNDEVNKAREWLKFGNLDNCSKLFIGGISFCYYYFTLMWILHSTKISF